jgi:hypothetical protein
MKRKRRITEIPAERLQLSERDSLLVLNLLENPPPPNERLIAAMESLRSMERDRAKRKRDRQPPAPLTTDN